MPRLVDLYPRVSDELADALHQGDESALVYQLATLEVVQMCPCRDSLCQSFYTGPQPDGQWGPIHRNVVLDPPWPGMLILDVIDECIRYIEVLDRQPLD